jgi:hypothetical protein
MKVETELRALTPDLHQEFRTSVSTPSLIEILFQRGAISEQLRNILEQLHELRNSAAHSISSGSKLSEDEAWQYESLSDAVLVELRRNRSGQ